jgi:hypothetical protein
LEALKAAKRAARCHGQVAIHAEGPRLPSRSGRRACANDKGRGP